VYALKLDMSKAYKRIEWDFLVTVIKKTGFANERIKLVVTYSASISFNFPRQWGSKGYGEPQVRIETRRFHLPLLISSFHASFKGCRGKEDPWCTIWPQVHGGVVAIKIISYKDQVNLLGLCLLKIG